MINEKITDNLDICNTTNESQILKKEAQALKNNSKLLIEEAHAIRKTSNGIRNEPKILIKEAQALRNNSRKYYVYLIRKNRYINIKKIYANIEKELDLVKKDIKIHKKKSNSTICAISNIKSDNYYNKKNLKYHNKGICNTEKEISFIKNNTNYLKKKIDAIKIIRINDNTKTEINKLLIKLCDISDRLIYANSLLNLYRKKAHANKVKIVWVYYITVNMKICLYEIKYQLDKESLNIKNNTSVLVNVDNNIRLQRNYLLFSRDMEMILKNFQYRHFLYPELIGNRINANKIKLISSNKKIKSTINIDKNELSVIFRKKGNLSRYYTEISINIISIITENVYSEIKPLLHKITNKM